MLQGDFFHIISFANSAGNCEAELEINAAHPLFAGHFPGHPVVPGVCMIEMLKELLQVSVNEKIVLQKASYFKFLSVIDPRQDPLIQARISYTVNTPGEYDAVSSFSKKDTVCFKGHAVFRRKAV